MVAVLAHEALDLGDVVGPAGGGEADSGGPGHVVAGLQVVHHQHLPGRQGVLFHDLFHGPGAGLAQVGRAFPAVHRVRLGQAVFPVIPKDVVPVGVGNHAQQPALPLLPPEYVRHARVDRGHVLLHVGVPPSLLVGHLRVAQPHLVPEKGHHAGVEVPQEVVLQRAAVARAVLSHVFLEAGKVDRGGAVDDGVVVVDDQAGVFQIHGKLLRGA